MVECFDRIHLQLTETVLRPLRALRAQSGPDYATIRLPGRGCRIDLTVTKHLADHSHPSPWYSWTANENNGARIWSDDAPHDSPDAAYWSAVDLIGASLRSIG